MRQLSVVNFIVISVCAYSTCTHAFRGLYIPILPTPTELIEKTTSCDVVLDFSNMNLSIINSNFISSPFIKTLALRDNGIKSFQENTFDSLPSLETLDLSNNKLSAENLFSFGNMYALKSLNLDYNPDSLSSVTGMPEKVYFPTESYNNYNFDYGYDGGSNLYPASYVHKCSENQYYTNENLCENYSELKVEYEYPNLTHLSMKKIYISSLASDWANYFPKLSHLDMSENYFHETAAKVLNYLPTSLTSLTMRNAKLTVLESFNLKNITHLDLNENKFETLSSHYCYENTLCLRNLTNLMRMHIANCSVKKIEIDAFKDAKKLNYLDMSSNDFVEIPDGTFKYLPALSYFDLSKNKLNVMPDFSNLQNLTSLYMDDIQNKELLSPTGLETFSELPTLEVLSLRFNELTAIPSSFLNKLPQLIQLDLSYNSIATLPAWQWQQSLHRLSLEYNQIAHFEDITLGDAKSLLLLNLNSNKLTQIKLKSLKHLPDNVILKL